MTTKEILSHFQLMNIHPSDDVLAKCLEMCTRYHIDPEDFVDQWFAYTASDLNGAPPSLEALDRMERKEFQKSNKDLNFKHITPKSKSILSATSKSKIDAAESSKSPKISTPKVNENVSQVQKPGYVPQPKFQDDNAEENNVSYDSPSLSQAVQYNRRTDALSNCCSYGLSASFRRQCDVDIHIKLVNNNALPQNAKYMYEIMGTKSIALDNIAENIGQSIIRKHGLELSSMSTKSYTGEMMTYGCICPDLEGKLDSQSVFLEGTKDLSQGHVIKLAINKLPKYALFPGQIVAVKGSIVSGTFIVDNLYTDATLDLIPDTPLINDPLEIVAAAGPFTLQNNLLYEPLQDLLKYCIEYKPHILLLIGPFLEARHEGIYNKQVTIDFDSLFEELIEKIATTLADKGVKIIIVSSQKDVHHHDVYPTPPYATKESYSNVMFVPDPCMLDINGIIFGVTSADVLFHIGKRELFFDKTGSGMDKLSRLASHLLQQQSFYPLYPPDKGMNIDHDLLYRYGMMDYSPHVLILPSNFRNFAKMSNSSLIVNPGRLGKGLVGGSFARFEISPGSSNRISQRIACEVLKI